MRNSVKFLIAPAILLVAACGRSDSRRMDDALSNDLALASAAQPYQPQQFVSPQEQGFTSTAYVQPRPIYGGNMGQYNPAPVRRSQPRIYRTPTTYPAPAPVPQEPVRHTKRDAAIGAAAGAVLGAATSRDKVKGGLIGAAAGGILGAVIGHTMDVERP